jgi:hypothetical protein
MQTTTQWAKVCRIWSPCQQAKDSWHMTHFKHFYEVFAVNQVNTSFLPGLPDGLLSNQKYQFGKILKGLGMEKVVLFFGHLEYITAIWYIFGHLVI